MASLRCLKQRRRRHPITRAANCWTKRHSTTPSTSPCVCHQHSYICLFVVFLKSLLLFGCHFYSHLIAFVLINHGRASSAIAHRRPFVRSCGRHAHLISKHSEAFSEKLKKKLKKNLSSFFLKQNKANRNFFFFFCSRYCVCSPRSQIDFVIYRK